MVLWVARTRRRRRKVSSLIWTLKHCLRLCQRSDPVIQHLNCTFDHSNLKFRCSAVSRLLLAARCRT